jgi:allantoinase
MMSDARFEVVIRGGTVVNAGGQIKVDVAISDGKIAAVAAEIAERGEQEIDASGLHLFPGGIDPHVHFNEPGRADWEGFETGTRALAAGGYTTFFDMPLNSDPPVTAIEELEAKQAVAREKSLVNAYFWGGLIPGNLGELEAMHRAGAIGFKAFMSNSGIAEFPAVDDYTLYKGMETASALGAIVAVHAENDGITGGLSADAIKAGRTGIRDYLSSRPVVAEVEAIQRAIAMAEATGCKLHIVHVSSGRGVEIVTDASARGVDVSCETCPHYLALTDDDVERLGAVAKCAPPIRAKTEQDALWARLETGEIAFIASDHSPAPLDMKQSENFFAVWGGIAGCQSTLSLMLTEGYHKRRLSLSDIAAITSSNVAARFGLNSKGWIRMGRDADLAVVDINAAWTLRTEDLQYRHKISPYVGMEMRGRVLRTIVGGKTVWES